MEKKTDFDNKLAIEVLARFTGNSRGTPIAKKAFIDGALWAAQFHKQETAELTEVEQLKQWKESMLKIWGPVLDWGQSKESGLLPGASISDEVLRRAKGYNILKQRLNELESKLSAVQDTQEKTFNLEDLKSKIRDFLDVREDIHPPNLDREWVITGVDELAQFIFDKYGSEDTQEKPDDRDKFALEFARYMVVDAWEADYREQRTLPVEDHLEIFKAQKRKPE